MRRASSRLRSQGTRLLPSSSSYRVSSLFLLCLVPTDLSGTSAAFDVVCLLVYSLLNELGLGVAVGECFSSSPVFFYSFQVHSLPTFLPLSFSPLYFLQHLLLSFNLFSSNTFPSLLIFSILFQHIPFSFNPSYILFQHIPFSFNLSILFYSFPFSSILFPSIKSFLFILPSIIFFQSFASNPFLLFQSFLFSSNAVPYFPILFLQMPYPLFHGLFSLYRFLLSSSFQASSLLFPFSRSLSLRLMQTQPFSSSLRQLPVAISIQSGLSRYGSIYSPRMKRSQPGLSPTDEVSGRRPASGKLSTHTDRLCLADDRNKHTVTSMILKETSVNSISREPGRSTSKQT